MQISPFAIVQCTIGEFISASPVEISGRLSVGLAKAGFENLTSLQIQSWSSQIVALQDGLNELVELIPSMVLDTIILEYTIPVVGRRIDAIVLHEDKVIVIEYKSGDSTSEQSALRQAQDYALDLADFHEPSRKVQLFPIALGPFSDWSGDSINERGATTNSSTLGNLLAHFFTKNVRFEFIDQTNWAKGRYFPVPKVVEAAVAAFNGHNVHEIAMSRSDPDSLERSKKILLEAVATAKRTDTKILCVLTGVPGAGKTLAGLNAVSEVISTLKLETEQATYLSGNSPLVNVLREALYRDRKERGVAVTKTGLEVLIREMHRFVSHTFDLEDPPAARMIVFDEAQRAWSQAKNFKKFGRDVSEPSMVLQIMDRHKGWAVIVALVGGGQEIHDGEAGLEEWGAAIAKHPHWNIWASPVAIEGGAAVAGSRLFKDNQLERPGLMPNKDLHLNVSFRSLDAEDSAAWVNAALTCNIHEAKIISTRGLPIYRCRTIKEMKKWLVSKQIGTRRTGIVASSAAARLRADGFETPTFSFMRGIDYVKWFLEPQGDVRSSNQLEVALSEFEIQGLEIDFVGLVWGGDLLFDKNGAAVRRFSGSAWQAEKRMEASLFEDGHRARAFQEGLNRYRVLLTRYRKAMIICVPLGSETDSTRNPKELDQVYEFLGKCGIQELKETLNLDESKI